MAKPEKRLRGEIYCVRCGRTVVAADPGRQYGRIGGVCPDGCPPVVEEPLDLTTSVKGVPPGHPYRNDGDEPEWVARVREKPLNLSPTGPPPGSISEAELGSIQFDTPFVELTLVETGRYTGPTRGRVCHKEGAGFEFLTHQGLFFVPWANLAFWRFLPEI